MKTTGVCLFKITALTKSGQIWQWLLQANVFTDSASWRQKLYYKTYWSWVGAAELISIADRLYRHFLKKKTVLSFFSHQSSHLCGCGCSLRSLKTESRQRPSGGKTKTIFFSFLFWFFNWQESWEDRKWGGRGRREDLQPAPDSGFELRPAVLTGLELKSRIRLDRNKA